MAVKPIPEGYHSVTPYLTVDDAEAVINFARQAFGATLTFRQNDDKGAIRHAEIRVGDSVVMIGQARDQWKARPSTLYVYVEDIDATYKKAIAAGGKSLREPTTEFYGDRSGGVEDSQGNQWWIATHVEDVSPEELKRRAEAAKH